MKINIRLMAYAAATILFGPFFLIRKLSRFFRKNYKYEFDAKRHSIPVLGPTRNPDSLLHVVFVASGLGEKQMAEQLTSELRERYPMTSELRERYPKLHITWAIKVEDIVAMVQSEQSQQAVTYMPFDNIFSTNRWLQRLKPDVVVSIENLWIPCIAWGARDQGAKVAVVSGNSGRFKSQGIRGLLWRAVNTWSLRAFNIICLHSEAVRKTLEDVLPPEADVRVTGVIKLTRPQASKTASPEFVQWLSSGASERKALLAAGSTRNEDEETFVLDAFARTREVAPCRLLLAPRHMHRADEVEKAATARGFAVQRRSQFLSEVILPKEDQVDVFILDTLGELASAYGCCEAAFIGGTLRAPGHNVIEPVEKGKPVSFGPGRGEPTPTQLTCMENGIGFRVTSPEELAEHWIRVLTDEVWAKDLSKRAQHVLLEQEEIFSANLEAIIELIENRIQERSEQSDSALST